MKIEFSDFLKAKYALDHRSLNRDVWEICNDSLSKKQRLKVLDMGTGTGGMIKRLLECPIQSSLTITALDKEVELLKIAQREIAALLTELGFEFTTHDSQINAHLNARSIEISFVHAPLDKFDPSDEPAFGLITAHAFIDIVPLAATVTRIQNWLADDGIVYATLCYDGGTALFPPYENEVFETRLLTEYDASMENRFVDGQRIGGARSGRRLYGLLDAAGFDIAAYGSSDWNITPLRGRYRDSDKTCLTALLSWIRDEGAQSNLIDQTELARWHENRCRLLDADKLGLIVHQLDILASRKSAG
ncbi:MAG: class I SAM-dependent methyltransferase [Pseudomonadota bacterium]